MEIIVSNDGNYEINEEEIKKIAGMIIENELGKNKDYYLEIIITNDGNIQKLNREFRKIDLPTDVLTFVYDPPILGEIYISYETIEKQARFYNHSITEELYYILVHGLLHICGYDHIEDDSSNETMFIIQRKYFEELKKHL
jgi:probable rRNA maturation factor